MRLRMGNHDSWAYCPLCEEPSHKGQCQCQHRPKQKCLFYENKWRNVCLACGKVEMEDGWRKI